MPTKIYYPTFLRRAQSLNAFLERNQRDLVALNAITGSELAQLNALASALNAIVGPASTWPKYQEGI